MCRFTLQYLGPIILSWPGLVVKIFMRSRSPFGPPCFDLFPVLLSFIFFILFVIIIVVVLPKSNGFFLLATLDGPANSLDYRGLPAEERRVVGSHLHRILCA